MNDPRSPAGRAGRPVRVLLLIVAAVLLVSGLVVVRQFTSRAADIGTPAADCQEEPPPESFTLAECDADGKPVPAPASPPAR